MDKQLNYYRILPGIVEAGKETEIEISPLDPRYTFQEDKKYSIKIQPMTENERGMIGLKKHRCEDAVVRNGKLCFKWHFANEQEYTIRVYFAEPRQIIVQLSVYAVEKDLFALRPLKGDLHIHSCRLIGPHIGSCETPAYAAANYRQAGYDFMILTDHECYAGSVEMQESYKDVKLGMELMNGEEIHAPDNFLHFNNIGGKSSVNSLFHVDEEKYFKEVQEIVDNEEIEYEDKFLYASCLWVARKTREAGGLAMLNHPHWVSNVYSMPDKLTKLLLKNKVFDIYEVTGASNRHMNNMKAAFYYSMMKEGIELPPMVAVSDSHGTANGVFKNKYTIVFAKENKREAILEAIKENRVAAVETFGDGEYNVLGDYRYVSFARFLIEWYFPYFPMITNEEGKLMHQYILGCKESGKKLNEKTENTTNLYKKIYGIK
ncbi:MAG: hypothetical protein IKU45_06510 [Clostridia bacterium]|nr:hypothetical protein [Clostridia bacterium]